MFNFKLIGYVESDTMMLYVEDDTDNQHTFMAKLDKQAGSAFLLQCNKILDIRVVMTTVRPDWMNEPTRADLEKAIDEADRLMKNPIAPSGGQRYQVPSTRFTLAKEDDESL
jgi:hypothetical protein